jgi:hypothetical protein
MGDMIGRRPSFGSALDYKETLKLLFHELSAGFKNSRVTILH